MYVNTQTPYIKKGIRSCVNDLTKVQANVMLAYPLAEAETLLDSKLEVAESSLLNCEEDLDFLREQITVSICTLQECGRFSSKTTAD